MPPKKSPFDSDKCLIPTVWCGEEEDPPNKIDRKNNTIYTEGGTRGQCLQKGFGAGMHSEKAKSLSQTSLQNIKYVGEKFEEKFKSKGIRDLPSLANWCRTKNEAQVKKLLSEVFKRSNGIIDYRGYNSTLLWLNTSGLTEIPSCKKLW